MRTPSEREESASDGCAEWVVVVLLASARRSGAKGWHDGQRATEGCTTYIVCLNSSDEGMHAQRRSVDRPLGSAVASSWLSHGSECGERAVLGDEASPLGYQKETPSFYITFFQKKVIYLGAIPNIRLSLKSFLYIWGMLVLRFRLWEKRSFPNKCKAEKGKSNAKKGLFLSKLLDRRIEACFPSEASRSGRVLDGRLPTHGQERGPVHVTEVGANDG